MTRPSAGARPDASRPAEPDCIRDMLAHLPPPMRVILPRLAPRLRARCLRRVHGTAAP